MTIPVPPSIQLLEDVAPSKPAPGASAVTSLLDSKTAGVLSNILGKSRPTAPVNAPAKDAAKVVVESKFVDPLTAAALSSILSKTKPLAEANDSIAEVLGGKMGTIDPVFAKMEKAVGDYLGTGQFSMEVYPDPRVEGSWAIRVERVPKDDRPIFFLIRGGSPIDAESLEEVEFTSWPPTSGGRLMRESDVKNWITSKINAALISLGVPQEKHGEYEDAVFSAALAGKLGNGLPSDETAQAIANMVTELAGTAAAQTPAVISPEAPEAGVSVGKEAGVGGDVAVEVPQPEAGAETPVPSVEPEVVAPEDAGPISQAELEKLAAELTAPEPPEVEPEELGDREVPEEPEMSTPEDIEAEVEKMADEMHDGDEEGEEPEGMAAEKGVSGKDVDPDELKMGIEVEQEHTDDVDKARKIALDHLAEFPTYYTELKKMEKKLSKAGAKKESIGELKTEEDVMAAIDSLAEDELSETLHGLRNKERIQHGSITLVADTVSDPEWVYLYREDGTPVARQQKAAGERVFRQGTNPDYTGSITFPLQVWRQYGADPAEWHYYDRHAKRGDILYQIHRLVESTELSEKVEKRGNKWCTVHCHGAKKGQVIHCFDTKEKAMAQHQAIQMSKHEGVDIQKYPEVGYHTIDASGHVVRGTLTQNKTANTQLYHAGYDAWYSTKEDAATLTKRLRGPKRFWSDGMRWSITDSIDEAKKGKKYNSKQYRPGEAVLVTLNGVLTDAIVVDVRESEIDVEVEGVLYSVPPAQAEHLEIAESAVEKLFNGADPIEVIDEIVKQDVIQEITEEA